MKAMRAILVGIIAVSLVTMAHGAGRRSLFDRRPRLDDRPKLKDFSIEKRGQRSPRVEDRYYGAPRTDNRPRVVVPESWQWAPYDYELFWDEEAYPGLQGDESAAPPWLPQEFLGAGELGVSVAGGERLVQTTVQPLISNGALYLAANDYFAALGTQMYYDAVHVSAVGVLPDGRWIAIPLGRDFVYLDRQQVALRQPTAVVAQTLMVPVRAISDVLGVGVRWEPITRSAVLTIPWAQQQPVEE